jgi:hypothetical protein
MVEFFETLFSRHPGRLRKAHNIPLSTIAVTGWYQIPTHLRPVSKGALAALEELQCKALHRDVKSRPPENVSVRTEPISHGDLAREVLSREQSVQVCFNTRREAQEFTVLLGEGAYHLSSLLRSRDQNAILQEIEKKLRSGERVLLSTSPIGSHLMLDIPVYYRVIGPLDAMASGNPDAEHILFQPDPWMPPTGTYGKETGLVRQMLENGEWPADHRIFLAEVKQEYDADLRSMNPGAESVLEKAVRDDDYIKLQEEYVLVPEPHNYVIVDQGHEDYVQVLLHDINSKNFNTRKRAVREIQSFAVPVPFGESKRWKNVGEFDLWEGGYDARLGIVLP